MSCAGPVYIVNERSCYSASVCAGTFLAPSFVTVGPSFLASLMHVPVLFVHKLIL